MNKEIRILDHMDTCHEKNLSDIVSNSYSQCKWSTNLERIYLNSL